MTSDDRAAVRNNAAATSVMTIGTLARRTGVPVKTLREYEDLGFIYTVGRRAGNYRLFGDEALWCVGVVGTLRGLGLTLGWCAVNFWRCRHAHCVITGAGWLALAAFSFLEAGLGRSVIHGDEGLVFLGVLGVGLAFEGAWYVARGTNAVSSSRSSWAHGPANSPKR
jgi:hypothetical protein